MTPEELTAIEDAADQAREDAAAASALALQKESYRQHCRSALLGQLVKAGDRERAKFATAEERKAFRPYEPAEKTTLAGMAAALNRLGEDADGLMAGATTFADHQEFMELSAKYPDRRNIFARAFRGQSEFEHHASVLRALREHDRLVTEEAAKE